MRKTKFPSGITLIELVIVLAISAVLIVVAISTNRVRGRRDFDNSMKQVTIDLKTIQNYALSGVGPSNLSECYKDTESDADVNDTGPLPTKCPAGSLFGEGITFGRSNTDPLFGEMRSADGATTLGKNYLGDHLASNLSGVGTTLTNFGRIRPYRNPVTSNPDVHKLPSNIGYAGSCYPSDGNCDFDHYDTDQPRIIVFERYGQLNDAGTAVGTSSIPLQTYVFDGFGWPVGEPWTAVVLAGYNATHQKDISLIFTENTGKYKAAIHIIPTKNQINLCTEDVAC